MLSHSQAGQREAQTDYRLMSCRARPAKESLQLLWNTLAIPHETKRSGHGRHIEACVTSGCAPRIQFTQYTGLASKLGVCARATCN
jgi:hypothetical protein